MFELDRRFVQHFGNNNILTKSHSVIGVSPRHRSKTFRRDIAEISLRRSYVREEKTEINGQAQLDLQEQLRRSTTGEYGLNEVIQSQNTNNTEMLERLTKSTKTFGYKTSRTYR